MNNMSIEKKVLKIVDWLKKYLEKSNLKGFAFGISGGIDSALIAAILSKYFPASQSLGIIMNIENSLQDIEDANLVVEHTKINFEKIDLEPCFNNLKKLLKIQDPSILGNLKSRLRMVSLYAIAQKNNFLVVGTSNADEYYTGYFTKYGDSAADIWPIINLLKKDVYECAKFLGMDSKIINKKPTAGLYENQYDEDELKVSYEEIDKFLIGEKISEKSSKRIQEMHKNSEHKRSLPSSPLNKSKLI